MEGWLGERCSRGAGELTGRAGGTGGEKAGREGRLRRGCLARLRAALRAQHAVKLQPLEKLGVARLARRAEEVCSSGPRRPARA